MTQTESKTLTELQQERHQADLRSYMTTLRELAAEAVPELVKLSFRTLTHPRAFPNKAQLAAERVVQEHGPELFPHAEALDLDEATVAQDLAVVIAHQTLAAATPPARLQRLEARTAAARVEHDRWNADGGTLQTEVAKLQQQAGAASDAYDVADRERMGFEEAAQACAALRERHTALLGSDNAAPRTTSTGDESHD